MILSHIETICATFSNMLIKTIYLFLILIPNLFVLRIIILNQYGFWKIVKVILAISFFLFLLKICDLQLLNLKRLDIFRLLALSIIMSILIIVEKEICQPYISGLYKFMGKMDMSIIYISIFTFIQLVMICKI